MLLVFISCGPPKQDDRARLVICTLLGHPRTLGRWYVICGAVIPCGRLQLSSTLNHTSNAASLQGFASKSPQLAEHAYKMLTSKQQGVTSANKLNTWKHDTVTHAMMQTTELQTCTQTC